jgi:hypothetical protein
VSRSFTAHQRDSDADVRQSQKSRGRRVSGSAASRLSTWQAFGRRNPATDQRHPVSGLYGAGACTEDIGPVFGITSRQVRNRVDDVFKACGLAPDFEEAFDRIRRTIFDADVRREAYEQALSEERARIEERRQRNKRKRLRAAKASEATPVNQFG